MSNIIIANNAIVCKKVLKVLFVTTNAKYKTMCITKYKAEKQRQSLVPFVLSLKQPWKESMK